jgi:hypothetical protein
MIQNIEKWLQELPAQEFLAENNDRSQYIPIGHLEILLDELGEWSTRNFQFKLLNLGESGFFFTGSVELTIKTNEYERTICGATTLPLVWFNKPSGLMTDFEPTILAECVKNAAKQLGNKFGRHLNERVLIDADRKPMKKPATLEVRKKYAAACAAKDEAAVKDYEAKYIFTV